MAKYKIGVTEAGDAGLDLSWVSKLDTVDGAIVITKAITPQFIEAAVEHSDKLIVHATITGYGRSVLEPNVRRIEDAQLALAELEDDGFPAERIVVRVDPIIPTLKGLRVADKVIRDAIQDGYRRFRVSLVDMYPHVRERFTAANLRCPYGSFFTPQADMVQAANDMIASIQHWFYSGEPDAQENSLRIESCAEPGLTSTIQCGCVSAYDLRLLGLDTSDIDERGAQRPGCRCYSGKVELLEHKAQCPNGCLYCYWKDS